MTKEKVGRIYGLFKEIQLEVKKIIDTNANAGLGDSLQAAVDLAKQILDEKFKNGATAKRELLDHKDTSEVLESCFVVWNGYCSTLEESSLRMADDNNWDLPIEDERSSPVPAAAAAGGAAVGRCADGE